MRKTTSFNENWLFSKDKEHFEPVTLPHTWNAVDGCDGKGEYYRGECYYTKTFDTPIHTADERVCLDILALSLCGKVFVNNKEVGSHEGGYSSFVVDITDALNPTGSNELMILADNSEHSHIYPQMADFTFYGGLYRGVNLLILPKTHFDVFFHGASGFSITSEVLQHGEQAMLHLNSWVIEPSEDYTICYQISDHTGHVVIELWRPATAPKADVMLPSPHLWQGMDDPYLYHAKAMLVYRNEVVDEVFCHFGIRSFHVDPEKGFFLNGKPMMLRGVSRHQDRLYQGYALTRKEHFEDAALIREIGANTVRLAHYQHSQDFYDACDEYGFIVWAEIPYISCQSDDPKAHENCREQMKDLIYQNYNHPSICFWGLSNEITIGGEKSGLVENHKDLNALVKSIDPGRLTTIAHVTLLPMDSPLHGITDVESYNHYFGWYGGTYDQNEKWLDEFHAKYPNICLGLSEYGAEGIITYQPDDPRCRDYSEAYQAEYHEHMVKILMERPYLWSTHVWNMFDFGCAARNEGGVAGRNNKGLVTMDRKIKKEAFYVYKAYWSSEPFVYLCGRRYARRAGQSTTIKVYSNQPQVSLYVNGELFTTQVGSRIFVFENVPLQKGFTYLTAVANHCSDIMTLEQVDHKPEIYTLPQDEEDGDGVANWFSQVDITPSNAPMEFSTKHFSVYDKVKDIVANDKAYEILAGSLRTMTGMKLHKSMLGMLGDKTLLELTDMMHSMGNTKDIPENAFEIINTALSKVSKN
ncbi:MAG: beta-galactosidase [Lachnospiraceae bacterium]|nr:beta-galactosidase [Lachnospiraceae bacterium]